MLLLEIGVALIAIWAVLFYFFAIKATPEERCGWHPDGRD
jgi:hypothetical protein